MLQASFDIKATVVKLAIVAATMAATYLYGHADGYNKRDTEMQDEIGKRNEEAREKEKDWAASLADMTLKLKKEQQNAQEANKRFLDSVRAGTERLYVNVRGVQACGDSAAVDGNRNEARAELDPTTATNLISIANDGDDAIRQLNACIDAYNEIRK